ncbi:MAG: monovalent cation/H(+) antiporter subunit G [Verrucomicrobiales bacterium]|nr:monovalent cation/H(+) antiporter subunit G [Verrucomicrobiales bacterium]
MIQETIITIISTLLILCGLIFFLGAAVGLLRFPDFYTRMHAAGKGDTLSSFLVVLGFAVYQLHDFKFTEAGFKENWWVLLLILKLIGICAFIMITSPTSTHALMNAGWEDDIEPELKHKDANELEKDYPRK